MDSTAPVRKVRGISLLANPTFFSVVFSHFMTDLYVGQRSVFLVFMASRLGMSNTTLGLITTLAVVTAGLSQPFFGYVADRIGARRMIVTAMVWTIGMFTLSVLMPLSWGPALLVLANLGAGMYHPAGTTQATRIGRTALAGRETTALSYFFLFGQTGFFLGPLFGGLLLNQWGERGLLVLTVLGIPAIIFASNALRSLPVPDGLPVPPTAPSAARPVLRIQAGWAVAALILVTAFQAWSQQNITTFVPKHLVDLGQPASIYGIMASVFMAGTALGNLAGGNLADRVGKKPVIMVGMLVASLPLLGLGFVPFSGLWYGLLFLAGSFNGAAYSALVSLGQRLAPGGGALASGLVLGFIFSSGALGTALTGSVADSSGFPTVYMLTAAITLAGGLLALAIRDK